MSAASSERSPISVVIPCWNDAAALAKCLAGLGALEGLREIILADASEDGACRRIAEAAGAVCIPCARPNRGAQMNAGAAHATGSALLFHHADTMLTPLHVTALRTALDDAALAGGAFHRQFDDRHPALRPLQPVAQWWNERRGTIFGDQSIWVRRAVFDALGGFAEIPLMEDVDFSRRLRRAGRIALLTPAIASSGRKHARQGAWRTSIENGCLILLFKLGVSPHRLHRWYYRHASPARAESAAVF